MDSQTTMIDDIAFPNHIPASSPLSLLGHGITDIEIHFLQIKQTAIGLYFDRKITKHLGKWASKSGDELAKDDAFFDAVVAAPVGKMIRIAIIKEIKGGQYGGQLETAVRDRLAEEDKFEEEEEESLEKVVEFFQSKYFKKGSVVSFYFPESSSIAEVSCEEEGKEATKIVVENANVVEMIKRWYLGGSRAISPSSVSSLAKNLAASLGV